MLFLFGLDGRVVMQRPAKPFTPVRFRIQPPTKLNQLYLKTLFFKKSVYIMHSLKTLGNYK